MRAEREKNIISVSKPMVGSKERASDEPAAVNPWLGNERSRAFVESKPCARVTSTLLLSRFNSLSLLFHPDDLQTYPLLLLLLLFSSFDEEKEGDTSEIFSTKSIVNSPPIDDATFTLNNLTGDLNFNRIVSFKFKKKKTIQSRY